MPELMLDVRGRDVLLVDDIFDTGHTLERVMEKMQDFGPASVRSAVLLRKKARQEVDYDPDFVAFDIPDEFVVGYGLDYEDMYRNLPYLAALEPDDLAHSTRSCRRLWPVEIPAASQGGASYDRAPHSRLRRQHSPRIVQQEADQDRRRRSGSRRGEGHAHRPGRLSAAAVQPGSRSGAGSAGRKPSRSRSCSWRTTAC